MNHLRRIVYLSSMADFQDHCDTQTFTFPIFLDLFALLDLKSENFV